MGHLFLSKLACSPHSADVVFNGRVVHIIPFRYGAKLLDKPPQLKQDFPTNSKKNLSKKFKTFQKKKNLTCFPAISSQKFGFSVCCGEICGK
jgi:hypothetical protein